MFTRKTKILLVVICLLTATFLVSQVVLAAPPQYTLTTEVQGSGSVDPSGGTYKKNTVVPVEANANSRWIFDHWEGDLSGNENPTTITMNSNKHVIAVFVTGQQYDLTTTVVGSGSVNPSSGTYVENTVVPIEANANSGWIFDHWEGDLSGNENPTTITMNSNKHVIAVFVEGGTVLDRAGLRSSPYGISPFPPSSWWDYATTDMASRWSGAAPEVIWLVGEVMFPTSCQLSFPNPTPGITYPDILFKAQDEYESYFSDFDQAGIKVWMAVEPGNAEVSTLIDLAMMQYGHHSCIIGFAVDVEWYKNKSYQNGKAVTDAEAQTWSEQVRSYNSSYLLCTKHWLEEKMPPTYRTAMMFLNDSQGFRNLSAMVNDFAAWGQYFSDGDVGFQYGYARDKKWWKNLSDPPGDIGNEILNNVSNATDLFWVDFTAYDIWPEGSAMAKETSYDEACAETGNSTPLTKFELYKNYPNPFNPTTTIEFSIPKTTNVRLTVFDLLGREITQLINEQKFAGKYSAVFDGSQLSSGVYIFRLEAENVVLSKKMLLVK